MKNKVLIAILVSLLVISFVLAEKPESKNNAVTIPSKAVEVSPGVFYLGEALDKGRIVEGYAFIKYKEGHGKPTVTSSCYGFLAKGAKWKIEEPYIVNPTNTRNLDETFVMNNLAFDINKWETAARKFNILGVGSSTNNILVADMEATDGKNEVYFADIADSNAIAITIVWGYFGGPTLARELVEWDQVYDDADFNWGVGEADKMDFENIATHELGHSVGLDDIYTNSCSAVTMYGYSTEGETIKRDLASADITGIKKLYN